MFPARAALCLSLVFLSQAKPRLRLGDLTEIPSSGAVNTGLLCEQGCVSLLAPSSKDGFSV